MNESAPIVDPAKQTSATALGILAIIVPLAACLISVIPFSAAWQAVRGLIGIGVAAQETQRLMTPEFQAEVDQLSQILTRQVSAGGVIYFGGAVTGVALAVIAFALKPVNRKLPIAGLISSLFFLLSPLVLVALLYLWLTVAGGVSFR